MTDIRRVLGLDVATKTGWCVVGERQHHVAGEPELEVVQAGTFAMPKTLRIGDQLDWLRDRICGVMMTFGYVFLLVAYEKASIVHGRNAKTLSLQHMQYGAVEMALATVGGGTGIARVSPADWHRAMLGTNTNGSDKDRLKKMAVMQLEQRTGYKTSDYDIADAGLIACYAMGLLRLGMLKEAL